jgi:glycine dehydrogenase subunit 2
MKGITDKLALVFELGHPGRTGFSLPACDVPDVDLAGPGDSQIPAGLLRSEEAALPELSEGEAVRHFTRLSTSNYGVDSGFYPLGSCTMKYNPKINDEMARLPGFAGVHPLQPDEASQGCLELLYRMDRLLAAITGMARVTLQPAAGAHGELCGLMIIRAYHEQRGDHRRRTIIVPDSAHGTNPASAAMAQFDVAEVRSDSRGLVDLADLDRLLTAKDGQVAGLMLTNPNTLGLFEEHIVDIAAMIHAAGGLLYYDGANANAILGRTTPGAMGFDVVHLNLHKTFSTPHGGGGPGSGPVGVRADLVPFLPGPMVEKTADGYFRTAAGPLSIGRIIGFNGHFLVAVRACAYILGMGPDGLRQVAEAAVLNANYLRVKLAGRYLMPFDRPCMHEVVLSGQRQKDLGVSTMDIAKRLIDFGYYPPTVYFPLVVKEAMMIEPTETESQETLDAFSEAMIRVADEAERDPALLTGAPHYTAIARLDETRAARTPVLRYR